MTLLFPLFKGQKTFGPKRLGHIVRDLPAAPFWRFVLHRRMWQTWPLPSCCTTPATGGMFAAEAIHWMYERSDLWHWRGTSHEQAH